MALSVFFLNSSCFVHCWVPFACLALLGHSLTAWSRLCACLVVCLLFLHFCVCEIVSRGRRCHRDVDNLAAKHSSLELTCLSCAWSLDSLSLPTFGVTRSFSRAGLLHRERAPRRVMSLASCVLLFLFVASPGVSASWTG